MSSFPSKPLAIALHGGSGTLKRNPLDPATERLYREALQTALDIGWAILVQGGSARDAVEATAAWLEDCPLFNAGRGAVFTADGTHELDAAIMCGRTRKAGAVAGIRDVRHPVSLARRVMETTPYVFLAGAGAEAFADTTDLERVDSAWFATEFRRGQLDEARRRDSMAMDHDFPSASKFGTVGVVALDAAGDLGAATSTGGLTNKKFGRIGDSPVIGAGTFADNATCAVSCTGYGEEFLRAVVAHDVSARMSYLGESLQEATGHVVRVKLPAIKGSGGLVAVDAKGNLALPFNTGGMYRAWRSSLGSTGVAIFADEPPARD